MKACPNCRFENDHETAHCSNCGSGMTSVGSVADLGASGSQPQDPLATRVVSGARTSADRASLIPIDTVFASRYRIRRSLGAGGMGAVYLAFDQALDVDVALKVIRANVVGDDVESSNGFEHRFKQELLLARQISHPNVLRIHDLGEAGGIKYITMSYVEGADLAALLRSGSLPLPRLLHMATQLASGLEAAHAAGVVHRDLKPQNILVDATDRLYISDFGLAKSLEPGTLGLTRTGDFLGTPLFAAPEQVQGTAVDHRADVYAYGLILYQMATGSMAFAGDTAFEVMFKRLRENPPNPKSRRPDLPSYLDGIVMRCLEKEPANRYQSVTEVLADLRAEQAPEVSARSRTIAVTVPVVSRARATAIAAVAAVLLAAGATYFLYNRGGASGSNVSEPRQPVRVTVAPFRVLGEEAVLTPVAIGIGETVSSKLFQLEGVAVVAASAADRAKDDTAPAQRAKELGADFVVSGTVQGSADSLRVTASLDDAAGSRVWSNEFTGLAADLLTLEDRVFSAVLERLNVRATGAAGTRAVSHPTENLDAYGSYLKGRAAMRGQQDIKNVQQAIGHYEEALKHDPRFALAYAGIADSALRMYRSSREPDWAQRALSAAQQAQGLDDTLPEVHLALGNVYLATGRTAQAIVELRRVVEMAPNSDDAHRRLGGAYLNSGRADEAIAAYRKAVEVNPYHWFNSNNLGVAYVRLARYPEAVEAMKRVIELTPDNVNGYNDLGAVYIQTGQFDLAVEALQRALKLQALPQTYTNLAMAYAASSQFADAVAALEKGVELAPKSEVWVGNLADGYRWAGDASKARATYERAITLAVGELRLNPKAAATKGHLALYYAKTGRGSEAQRLMTEARAVSPANVQLIYNEALMFELLGQRDKAVSGLAAAFKAGYPKSAVAADPDMRALRTDPKYQAIEKAPTAQP
jgi:Flp pilus assembly protein TadD/TolB-like protein